MQHFSFLTTFAVNKMDGCCLSNTDTWQRRQNLCGTSNLFHRKRHFNNLKVVTRQRFSSKDEWVYV